MKNRSYHADNKRSPYKPLFSTHPKVGLYVLSLPEAVLNTLRTGLLRSTNTSACDPLATEQSPRFTYEPVATDVLPLLSTEKPYAVCGFDVVALETSLCALYLRKRNES